MPLPLAAWASAQNALKVAIFRLKIEKIFWGGAMPLPLAAWASAQNALKVAIFRLKIEKIFWGGAMPPPQTPASFSLHSLNHNVVSNMLVLSPIAVCIHTTARFPTTTVSGV